MKAAKEKSQKSNAVANASFWILFPVFSCGVLLYFGSLIVQIYNWLRNDEWVRFPVTYFLELLGVGYSGLYSGRDWAGVKRMLAFVVEQDAGFVMIGIGLSPLIVAFIVDNYRGKA